MSVDLERHLAGYGEQLEMLVEPFAIDELTAERAMAVAPIRRPVRPLVVVVGAAVAVLVLIGGLTLLLQTVDTEVVEPPPPTFIEELPSIDGWNRVDDASGVFVSAEPAEVVISHVVRHEIGLVALGVWAEGEGGSLHTAVWRSPDGVAWERLLFSDELDEAVLEGVTVFGSTLVLIGSQSSGPDTFFDQPTVWTSSDAQTWTPTPFDTATDEVVGFEAFTTFADRLLIGGWACTSDPILDPGSECHAVIWSSPDAMTWEESFREPTRARSVNGFATAAPGVVAYTAVCSCSEEPAGTAIWVSRDGQGWQESSFAGARALRIGGGSRGFIALGTDIDSGERTLWVSPDGASWEPIAQGSGLPPLDVTVAEMGGTYLALGHDPPAIWSSEDAVSWEETPIDFSPSSFTEAMAVIDNRLVVVGSDNGFRGVVWISSP